MLKCASRTIKATFNKGILRCSAVLSTRAPQDKEFNCILKFAPILIEHLNRQYGFYKTSCDNYTDEKQDKEEQKQRNSFLKRFDDNVFDALKWGGAFVLSYYFLQPKKKRYSVCFDCPKNDQILIWSTYHRTINCLLHCAGFKSFHNVLPEVKAAKETLKADKDNLNGLEKAHQKVLGIFHNWIGVKCMISGNHENALRYFTQSAEGENPAGTFNLGLCNEKGLGTSQNLKKAAELYKKAADLGHATAMYNLGVFYVQGLGGIKADADYARELFKAAASLGQSDAKKALSLEKRLGKESLDELSGTELAKELSPRLEESPALHLISDVFVHPSNSRENFEICDVKVKNCDPFELSRENHSTFDSDSGVVDLSPHNESEIMFA